MSIGNSFESDREQLMALFDENLTLEVAGLGHTYVNFRLVAIDGNPLPENQNISMYFYRDDIYSGPRPNYKGTLVAYDYGSFQNVAEFFYRHDFKESDGNKKLFIHELIVDLYQNKKRNR